MDRSGGVGYPPGGVGYPPGGVGHPPEQVELKSQEKWLLSLCAYFISVLKPDIVRWWELIKLKKLLLLAVMA